MPAEQALHMVERQGDLAPRCAVRAGPLKADISSGASEQLLHLSGGRYAIFATPASESRTSVH